MKIMFGRNGGKINMLVTVWMLLCLASPFAVGDDSSEEAEFQLVKISPNQRVAPGKDLILECQFDSAVTCVWFHQRVSEDIEDRYSYVTERKSSDNNRNETESNDSATNKDCSIRITSVGESDYGSWQCQGTQDDTSVISPEIMVNQSYGLELVASPTNVSAKLWDSVTLTCQFNQVVKQCRWYRNAYLYELSYNSKFLSNEKGTNTTDCSLQLSAVLNRDLTQWECSGETGLEVVRSNPAWIKLNNGLPVSERPTNVAAAPGSRVILQCGFPQSGLCVWHHGGSQVRIGGGYGFQDTTDNSSRLATKNCSIVISAVGPRDYGDWACQGVSQYGTHNVKIIYLTDSTYNVTSALRLLHHPANASVPLGKPVDLYCRFDRVVDQCHWLRAGAVIESFGTRYVHLGSDDGRHTQDCSIRFLATMNDDFQSWACSGTSGNQSVSSQPIWISQQSRLRITEQPSRASGQLGGSLTLPCKFNLPVQCLWSRRGRAVAINGTRYAYAAAGNDGVNSNDCSLNITALQAADFNIWSCKGLNRFGEKQSDIVWIRNSTIKTVTTTRPPPLQVLQAAQADMVATRPPSSLAIYILICISVVGIVATVAAVAYWRKTKKSTPYRRIESDSHTPLVRNFNEDYFVDYQANQSIFDDMARLQFP